MKKILTSIILLTSLAACSSDSTAQNNDPENNPLSSKASLFLNLSNIEPMEGQHYEGWLIVNGDVLSSGRFNLDNNNNVYSVGADGKQIALLGSSDSSEFKVPQDISASSSFILTIEPDNDSDPSPSSVHYVAGEFTNNVAIAVTDHNGAIGANFLGASGSYILATPTNGPTTHNQGVWFVNGGKPSLDLPVLNDGWVYEGWVVNTTSGEVTSTGTFLNSSMADSDGPGSTAGPNSAPPFPGQDFINPAKILNDGSYTTVISIEPSIDFDPAPFTLKILAGDIANGAAVTTNFSLDNISNEDSISITATIQ